jgi:hypothetical protein
MRNRAMLGPGSRKMGGAGIKAGKPPTSMAGSGLGAPKGGAAMAMGAPPMAPKVANVRPPGIGAGAPPPMPGGAPMGAKPAGPPPNPMSGGGGGMGGSGGFAKGGAAKLPSDRAQMYDSSKDPPSFKQFDQDMNRQHGPNIISPPEDYEGPGAEAHAKGGKVGAFKKGGSVGIQMGGGDTKPRHKGKSHK